MALNLSSIARSSHKPSDFWAALRIVPLVPRIDGIGLRFDGALSQESIVDPTAYDMTRGRSLQRFDILVSRKRNDRDPLADVADKEHRLLAADAMPPRHARECRIKFRKRMRSAAAAGLVELDENVEALRVVNVVAIKHRDQDRRVEKGLHFPGPRLLKSRSSRTR